MDLAGLDLVSAWDRANYRDVVALADAEDARKVRLAREFDAFGVEPPEMEVPDPWGFGDDAFDAVVEMLERVAYGVVEWVIASR